jgi:hypothetical protein
MSLLAPTSTHCPGILPPRARRRRKYAKELASHAESVWPDWEFPIPQPASRPGIGKASESADVVPRSAPPVKKTCRARGAPSGMLGQRRAAHPRNYCCITRGARSVAVNPRGTTKPAPMMAVDDASGIAIALGSGSQHRRRCDGGCDAAPCRSACRHSGRAVLLGLGRIEHLGQPWLPAST